MANEVKFTLAMDGGTAVVVDLDQIGRKLIDVNTKLKDAGGGAEHFGGSMRTVGDQLRGFNGTLGDTKGSVDSLAHGLKSAFIGSSVAVGLIGLKNTMIDFTQSMVQAQIQVDQLRNGLNFAVGRDKAVGELNFIRESSKTLGLEFVSTSQQFMKLSAAARGTSLEGQKVREIFTAVAQASTVMGLSAEQTSGALLSISQMISKNTVMSEELKGQLGERLPGAFQIAARAMGVTTEQLNKMLETGQVVAGDFLPKFAAELTKNTAPEVEAAAQSMQASVNRMANAWTELKQVVVDGGVGKSIASGMTTFSKSVGGIAESIKDARQEGAGFFTQFAILAGGALSAMIPFVDSPRSFTGYLREAEAELDVLQKKLITDPSNVYLKNETYQTYQYVQALKEARKAKDELQHPGAIIGSVPSPDRAFEREAAANQLKAQEYLLSLRQKLSGVDASYLPTLEKLNTLRLAGNVGDAEYISLVSDLATKNYKAAASTKTKLAAKKELQDFDEQVRDFIKANLKTLEDEEKAREKNITTLTSSADAMGQRVQKLQDEEAALRLSAAQNISLAQAIEQVEIARLQEARAVQLSFGDESAAAAIQREIDNRKKLIDLIGSKEARDADAKAAKKAEEAWASSNKSIGDGLYTALAEGGDNAIQKLIKDAREWFSRLVLSPIVAPISAFGASLLNPTAASAGQGGASAFGVAQSLGRLYDMVSGGLNVGARAGSYLANNAGGLLGDFGAGMSNVATMQSASMAARAGGAQLAGVIAGSVLNGISGYSISKALSGGYKIEGLNVDAIAAVASAIPGVGPIAGVIGGIVNRAFGMGATETRAQGIEGNFAAGSFTGNNFAVQHQDGGWFRGDKDWTDRSALDATTTKQFASGFAALQFASTQAAMSLGLSADAIANYSQRVSVQLTNDAAENEKIITKLFTDMSDALAKSVAPAIEAFAKDGESASTTLSRLSGAITTANAWLSMLRQRLFQVSLAGGDAASKLADAFGGLDNLSTASKTFYELYYTDGEKVAAAQDAMAKSLALVNLSLPTSKDALKDLAATLDLNTESGRQAYAVLLSIAPEFASTSDLMAKMSADSLKAAQDAAKAASDMAAALVAAFTGGGNLTPALNVAQLGLSQVASGATTVAGTLSYMHSVMGDTTSAVIAFGGTVTTLGTGLSGAQASALDLQDQMLALAFEAKRTEIDMEGLIDALDGVDTTTFVATVTAVFETLASRIKTTIDDITTERIAVREAALQIINPAVMGKGAIQAGINAINTNLPTNAGVVSANSALDTARANYEAAKANEEALSFWYGITRGQPGGAQARIDYYESIQVTNQALAQIAPAEAAAKSAIESYATAMQAFTIDASKSVSKLSVLRQETVKYYEAQKQLSDLMATSAANLRGTVDQYRYGQLSPEAQAAQLQAKFATAYTTALSVQGDGAALAGYGDKINGLLGPLIDKLTETGSTSLIGSYIAQAENIAALLESTAPVNYQQDSLAMLGSIDATLAALDASTQSAELIIASAITAGADRTAAGLKAIGEAISGKTIPAFAAGGSYGGGMALVGEQGPELINFNSPGRIYTASQTQGMLGNNEAIIAELRALRAEVSDLRAEARSTAVSSAKTTRILERVTPDGNSLQTVAA